MRVQTQTKSKKLTLTPSSKGLKPLKKRVLVSKKSKANLEPNLTTSQPTLQTSQTPLKPLETPINAGPTRIDVEKIVSSSTGEIAKKRRGRPAGSKNRDPGLVHASTTNAAGAGASPIGGSLEPAFSIPKEALAPLIKFPYKAAALKTGFDGFALDDAECEALVPLVDQCLRQYMPATQTAHGAAIALSVTLVMFTGMKYMAYLEFSKSKEKSLQELNTDKPQ